MSQDMSAVLGYLYIGGKSDAKDKAKLQKMGIKYILNCTPPRTLDRENGCPNFYEKEKSFVYKRISIFDNKGEDILSHLETAYNFIEEGKHYGKVLVHCHKGVSRSASFVIGYLMKKNEFTFDEALAHVQSCRPVVQPNTSFLQQLRTYQPNGNAQQVENPSEQNGYRTVAPGPEPGPQSKPSDESFSRNFVQGSVEVTNNERRAHFPDSAEQQSTPSPHSKSFYQHRKEHYHDEANPPPLVHYADSPQVLAAHDVSSPHSKEFLELRHKETHDEAHPGHIVHYAEAPQTLAAHDARAPHSKEFLELRHKETHDEAHPGHIVHYAEAPQTLAAHDITAHSKEFLELRRQHYRDEAHLPHIVQFSEDPQTLAAHDVRAPHSGELLALRKQHYRNEANPPPLVQYAEPPQILDAHDARAPHSREFLERRKQHYHEEAQVLSPTAPTAPTDVTSATKKARML